MYHLTIFNNNCVMEYIKAKFKPCTTVGTQGLKC